MNALAQQFPLDIFWRSYELRPAGAPPIPADYRAKIEAARPRFAAAMQDELGITIHSGPFGINSRPALIGSKFAEEHSLGDAFHAAVFAAYWQNGRDISDLDVLGDIADDIGLARGQMQAAIEDINYQKAVTNDVEQAYEAGITGVPALVFAEKYLVVGAHPTPALANMVEKVLELENGAALNGKTA